MEKIIFIISPRKETTYTFTTTQYNMGDATVNWHVWKDDGILNACWQHVQTSDFKPLISIGGS